jgi:hypothetical protein
MTTPWRPANNGAGKRRWFLIRDDSSIPVRERYHFGSDGRLVRYASPESARRAADRMNSGEEGGGS